MPQKKTASLSKALFQPYPKYMQITDLLRKQVLTQMKPGDRLAAEVELSRNFGVSRETIRQALEPLEREGLINRTRGRGSFVSERPVHVAPAKLTGMPEDLVALGLKTRAKLLDHTFPKADDTVAGHLNLEPGTSIVRIDRVRYFDDEPLSYHTAYLPLEIGARVLQEDIEGNSIVLVLGGPLSLALEEDRQIVEADSADVKLAEHLNVPIGSPVLVVRRVYITAKERAVAYFESYFRADRYRYTVKLRQAPQANPTSKVLTKPVARGSGRRS